MSFSLYQPQDWQLWRGIEAEGRWRGLPTLFVGQLAKPEDILALVRQNEHVYFNPHYFENKDLGSDKTWLVVETLLDDGHPVTVSGEANLLQAIPYRLLGHASLNFMLVILTPITSELISRINFKDTIRLQFDGANSLTFSMRSFVFCDEFDYEDDVRVL